LPATTAAGQEPVEQVHHRNRDEDEAQEHDEREPLPGGRLTTDGEDSAEPAKDGGHGGGKR
jgi:hypothetical protein